MPRRRRAAALAAALLAPLLLTAAPASGQQAPSQAQAPRPAACARASEEAPVLVDVTTLAPRAPSRPDQPFQVRGRLLNCGSAPVDALQVRLGVGPRLESRSLVRMADEEPVVGDRRLAVEPATPLLAPGQTTEFDLRLLVRDLLLGTRNGVFPLTVQVRGRVGEERSSLQVGLAHTFVPWFPDGPIAPTRLAWLLPLVDEPHRGPGEVLLDQDLEALLDDEPRGRLYRTLLSGTAGSAGRCDAPAAPPEGSARDPLLPCRGEPVPMTYALDPDLLYDVEAMARETGYSVLRGGRTEEVERSVAAQAWLEQLRSAAAGGSAVLALPYGDPDVVALTRPDSPVRDDVRALRALGQAVTEQLLGREPLTSVALLPPGPVGSAVDALAGGEVDTLVVDPAALPDPDPLQSRTPNARTTLATTTGPVSALVPDQGLSSLLERDPAAPGWQGARLAEQRWVAEVAALTAERPSESRTFLVAPSRRADLVPAVVAGAVADTGSLPWLCGVSLARAAAGTERCAVGPGGLVDDQEPAAAEPRGTPLVAETDELSAAHVAGLGRARAATDQLTEQVLLAGSGPATAAKARLLRARGRAASTAWREEPGRGRLLLRLLEQDVAALRGSIRLIDVRPVLLTGSAGTVLLTVENNLDQPVNVGVGLPRNASVRLESSDTAVQEIPPKTAVDVSVRVEARTSGRFTALATLLDAQGRPFGEEVVLEVRSTQYGRVALAVTGVAAAVLLVAAGARITRRALRRRPAEPAVVDEPVTAAPGSGV